MRPSDFGTLPDGRAIQAWRLDNGSGLSATKLSVAKQPGGASDVTYAGHPLYTYVGDTKPSDVKGQGLNQFGAAWYVLSPSGKKIDDDHNG